MGLIRIGLRARVTVRVMFKVRFNGIFSILIRLREFF